MICPICHHRMNGTKCQFCGYIHDTKKVHEFYDSAVRKNINKSLNNFIITLLFGWFGLHKFIQKKWGIGFLYLITVGGFLFGWIYDCIISFKEYLSCKKIYNTFFTTESNENINNMSSAEKTLMPFSKVPFINNDYDKMNGHDFEQFCANLLKENGFYNVEVTQASGDHGIDIFAEKNEISYAIQCKCYSSDIGNAAVQQAHSGKGFYKKDIAVVLTNRYFTPQAKQEAEVLGVKLWNRDFLEKLINKSAFN